MTQERDRLHGQLTTKDEKLKNMEMAVSVAQEEVGDVKQVRPPPLLLCMRLPVSHVAGAALPTQATSMQLDRLQKQNNTLQRQLEEAVTARTSAEVAMRKALSDAGERTAKTESQARSVVANLQTELGGARKRIEAAERAIADLRGKLEATAADAQKAHSTASTLEDALRLKKSEVEALKVAVTKAQHDSGTASNKAEASQREVGKLQEANKDLHTRVTAAEQTIAEANRRLAAAGKVGVSMSWSPRGRAPRHWLNVLVCGCVCMCMCVCVVVVVRAGVGSTRWCHPAAAGTAPGRPRPGGSPDRGVQRPQRGAGGGGGGRTERDRGHGGAVGAPPPGGGPPAGRDRRRAPGAAGRQRAGEAGQQRRGGRPTRAQHGEGPRGAGQPAGGGGAGGACTAGPAAAGGDAQGQG